MKNILNQIVGIDKQQLSSLKTGDTFKIYLETYRSRGKYLKNGKPKINSSLEYIPEDWRK